MSPALTSSMSSGGSSTPASIEPASSAGVRLAWEPTATMVTSLSGSRAAALSAARVAMSLEPPAFETPTFLPLRPAIVVMPFCTYSLYGYTGARFATSTRSAPPAFALSASAPPNCPIWIWFARSAALVCAPPLIDWRSTSRPLSLKTPFSNAYHANQSSALMLLYAAMTFVHHGRGVLVPAAAADVAAAGADVAGAPAPPAHAVARIARTAMRVARILLIDPPFPLSPDLRTPRLESILDTLEDRGEDHAGAGDEDHRRQHLRRLERLP